MRVKLRKRPVKAILGLVCVVALIIVIVLLLHAWEQQHYYFDWDGDDRDLYADDSGLDEIYYKDELYIQKPNVETILCIGIDKFKDSSQEAEYINTEQSDFLLALIIDHKSKSYTALQINRDTMTDITMLGLGGDVAGSFVGQIALAHTYGSGGADSSQNTVNAVSNLLSGAKIDHYLTTTMDAVSAVNDYVGGVEITLDEDLTSIDESFVKGATVTLSGNDALRFVRSRTGVGDGSNLSRMERQKDYMAALKEALDRKGSENAGFLLGALDIISDYLLTDCDAFELSDIANAVYDYNFAGFEYIKGEAVLGDEFMEYYIDRDALDELVIGLYYEKAKS